MTGPCTAQPERARPTYSPPSPASLSGSSRNAAPAATPARIKAFVWTAGNVTYTDKHVLLPVRILRVIIQPFLLCFSSSSSSSRCLPSITCFSSSPLFSSFQVLCFSIFLSLLLLLFLPLICPLLFTLCASLFFSFPSSTSLYLSLSIFPLRL